MPYARRASRHLTRARQLAAHLEVASTLVVEKVTSGHIPRADPRTARQRRRRGPSTTPQTLHTLQTDVETPGSPLPRCSSTCATQGHPKLYVAHVSATTLHVGEPPVPRGHGRRTRPLTSRRGACSEKRQWSAMGPYSTTPPRALGTTTTTTMRTPVTDQRRRRVVHGHLHTAKQAPEQSTRLHLPGPGDSLPVSSPKGLVELRRPQQ